MSAQRTTKQIFVKILGTCKREHIVADTLLLVMFLGLHKLGNICCGHKMFLNKIRNIFLCPGHKICVRNKCCAGGQTGKHLCQQQCVLVGLLTGTPKCARCTMQMSYSFASDLPLKNFCKLTKHAEIIR